MDRINLSYLQESYFSVYEGKVPWNDPSKPLQSGWTPAEKNAAKMKRTGVEDLSKTPSERDMERYGKMKSAADNENMMSRVKKEREEKKSSGMFGGMFGKKDKSDSGDSGEKTHQYKNPKGEARRKQGTSETETSGQYKGYNKKTWSASTGKSQSPIDVDDKRQRAKGSGPNPKKMKESMDVIIDYLLDEGFADNETSAEMIMMNMSEEWADIILEAKYGTKEGRHKLAMKIKKGEEIGKSGKGTGFAAVEKKAKKYGAKDAKAVAAAAMWKTYGK